MNSIAASAQAPGEPEDLRDRLLALDRSESELRQELKAARAQIAQLAQNEAMARSLLKESHAVTRALQERARLETAAAVAQLRESLKAESTERARSQAELARATDELRALRNQPDAEMETLRELFDDLMRGEALGRERLERLQQQVAEHERQRQEFQQQLDLERDARRKAEAQLLAPPPAPVVASDPAREQLREQLGQLQTAVAELEKRHVAFSCQVAEERGKARAQAERAIAEAEWSRDRAKAAAEAEREAKDALFELRRRFAQAQDQARNDALEHERSRAQLADQLALLRKQREEERERANAEIARRVQAIEELNMAAAAARAAAEKAAADVQDEKAVALRLRDEVGALQSARDAAQAESRDASLRERRTAGELADSQARAALLQSQLDELRLALTARTESESAARAAIARAEEQLAELRKNHEEERERANTERAQRVQALEEMQVAAVAAHAAAEKAAAQIEDERAISARLRDEVGRLESARDAAQGEVREASVREGRLALELSDAKTALAGIAAEAERLRASGEERGRTAEALASELALARGKITTMQDVLDRNAVALASLQAQKSGLEASLKTALQERDEEATSRAGQETVARQERAHSAERIARLEAEVAQARAEQERTSALATVRREALIAELGGRLADAEALLQAQLGQSPGEALVFLQLGRLHYAWAEGAPGAHDEIAERLLARAADLDPDDAIAPLYLGHVRLRRGLKAQAREAYREAIRRNAECTPAHEALAVLSARSMKRLARIAFAGAVALLLSSAALLVHRLVVS